MNYIYRIATIFLLVVFVGHASAQGNLPYYDDKPYHFGFSLGINAMDFGIVNSMTKDDKTGKIYTADVSTLTPGFSVGVITDLRLNRYLNLRFTPSLHFGEREISYSVNKLKVDSLTIQSVPMCFPLYLKYSAERKGNYRPYLIWGAGAAVDLGRKTANPLLLRPLNFYTEFGLGCDLYFPFFKLAPELKFSLGLNDVLTPLNERKTEVDDTERKFSNSLSKLTSKMLTLTFNFE